MKRMVLMATLVTVGVANAQQPNRNNFIQQQAYAEMQRVSGQIDAIQNTTDELERRVGHLERGNNTQVLQAEIASLKSAVAELRREMSEMRGEIVKDLSSRIAKMQPPAQPTPPPQPRSVIVAGPTSTYTVKSGDSLYLIAMAFNTSVGKIKELNNLKGDNLKVGQKLIVPQVKE